jgi:hypothetical protein
VCAFVAAVKFWGTADLVSSLTLTDSDATLADGWSGVAKLVYVVVCVAAAIGGFFAVRIIGWVVQWRHATQSERRRSEALSRVQSKYSDTDWQYRGTESQADAEPARRRRRRRRRRSSRGQRPGQEAVAGAESAAASNSAVPISEKARARTG